MWINKERLKKIKFQMILLSKLVDVVVPQNFIFPSTFDRLHCHLQRDNDGCYLDESLDNIL